MKAFKERIFNIKDDESFERLALEVFHYQYVNNKTYRQYCDYLKRPPTNIDHYTEIPFLPVSFFRSHKIVSGTAPIELVFSSSGTTSEQSSNHHLTEIALYEQSFQKAFHVFYGQPTEYCVLALLPSYLEREGSSLVYMANRLIELSGHSDSGFYLYNLDALSRVLIRLKEAGQKTLLLGITYALLDLVHTYPMLFPDLIVMETGGMKGRRREMIREEVHAVLSKGLGVEKVHSEYGMTELLSQAYSNGDGLFHTPPWMRILIRDTNDPLSFLPEGRTGGINIIDLANINSCSFVEVQDLGRKHKDGHFEVLGRFDNSQVRGCNLLVV
ncbi:MAG: acyl transferase [Bacteroidetes bacterium HGW-Bacteroidetes-1]|jgi:hypothetical protein|nr:MAG: acyl transferase [Bacteroidetes bacterium HGW-Bacteroidetes-1]